MRKNIFALVAAFSVLMITTFNTAFCADNEDENKVAGKKITTALALDGRELKPLKKDTSDEFFFGMSNKAKGSEDKGGKGETEQTEDDEKGRDPQDKESSRGLQRKAAEDETDKRLRIGHFVEYMRSSSLILPEELDYIRAYFINLGKEEGLTEQEQYDKLIHAYTQHQKRTIHGNPSALTILSIKDYPVSITAVPKTKGDASAPPSNHSEQKLLNGLAENNAKGQKVALYTMNSPCMMFLTEAPCVVKIGKLARGKHIKDMMVQYDVFYEYSDYKKYQQQWAEVFVPVKTAISQKIASKLIISENLQRILDFILKQKLKNTPLLKSIKSVQLEILGFRMSLETDQECCKNAQAFPELPKPFAGHVFQEKHGTKNGLSLLWSKDKDVLDNKIGKFTKFPPDFLENIACMQEHIGEIAHSIKQTELGSLSRFLEEMNHIY